MPFIENLFFSGKTSWKNGERNFILFSEMIFKDFVLTHRFFLTNRPEKWFYRWRLDYVSVNFESFSYYFSSLVLSLQFISKLFFVIKILAKLIRFQNEFDWSRKHVERWVQHFPSLVQEAAAQAFTCWYGEMNLFITSYCQNLLWLSLEQALAIKWISKLKDPTFDMEQMKLRNKIIADLIMQMQTGALNVPFNANPRFANLEDVLLPSKSTSKDYFPRDFKLAHDYGAFLVTDPVPKCGAFCYLAVIGRPAGNQWRKQLQIKRINNNFNLYNN